MASTPTEDGLAVITDQDVEPEHDGAPQHGSADVELTALRDAFVDAFNDRDLEALLALVVEDVDCPDVPGEGAVELAEEVEGIWERSPGAVLTHGSLEEQPCAVAWLPDEDGCWSRAALVCFDAAEGQLTLVAVPDDPDGLAQVDTAEPIGDELDAWLDWSEWDRGEETLPLRRDRLRP